LAYSLGFVVANAAAALTITGVALVMWSLWLLGRDALFQRYLELRREALESGTCNWREYRLLGIVFMRTLSLQAYQDLADKYLPASDSDLSYDAAMTDVLYRARHDFYRKSHALGVGDGIVFGILGTLLWGLSAFV